jgi:hypothetical protein
MACLYRSKLGVSLRSKLIYLFFLVTSFLFLACFIEHGPEALGSGGVSINPYQFLHLYGWKWGDKNRIDHPEDVTDRMYDSFWKLDEAARYQVFQTLNLGALTELVRKVISGFEPSQGTWREFPDVTTSRYFSLIRLMDRHYQLRIGNNLDLEGMRYLLTVGKQGEEYQVQIQEYFHAKAAREQKLEGSLRQCYLIDQRGFQGLRDASQALPVLYEEDILRVAYKE